MDKIEKALQKLTPEEKKTVKDILAKLESRRFKNLNLKKLKGRDDIFRIHKGKIRIIYQLGSSSKIFILAIERRSDTTYNF
ncbi:MAG: hypothetical protein A3A08_00945 [Candidatus Nealsonbacteria bacterium RIFCSPLOWO2_01_FULL_41_9]|uniref:Plasmid stabilization protein n=1 Tax=Candidatus Nealsonbacteria bacterium RIFCSPLOWO2_01_FULL_41_9 TaxID=1801671 RepID=A0A1G2EDT0_9BACT|nr:MAG: hypothetical protein A3A08_00945 [Candidatus Nealsonbacteria bacterium RIFCSPLOWO2_01_FULL_41_9]